MSSISGTRHVRFNDELAKPPSDRHRTDGLVYPRVAQIKGEANKHDSFDLHWKFDSLSAASRVGTVGTMEVNEDGRIAVSPRLAQRIQYPVSPPRIALSQGIGEVTTPKLSSTPLSNLLQNDKALSVLCTPPLLCSSRLRGSDNSSLDSNSAYSSTYSSSSSDPEL